MDNSTEIDQYFILESEFQNIDDNFIRNARLYLVYRKLSFLFKQINYLDSSEYYKAKSEIMLSQIYDNNRKNQLIQAPVEEMPFEVFSYPLAI